MLLSTPADTLRRSAYTALMSTPKFAIDTRICQKMGDRVPREENVLLNTPVANKVGLVLNDWGKAFVNRQSATRVLRSIVGGYVLHPPEQLNLPEGMPPFASVSINLRVFKHMVSGCF